MIEDPTILLTQSRQYAGFRQVVAAKDIQKVMGPSLKEVIDAVLAQGRKPAGPWFTHHLRKPAETFDFEVCVPVETAIEPAGRVLPLLWPRMKVARTVYHGNYSGLPAAWGEFGRWVERNSRHPGTEFWEVYTVNPHAEPDPARWRTELNWPLMD